MRELVKPDLRRNFLNDPGVQSLVQHVEEHVFRRVLYQLHERAESDETDSNGGIPVFPDSHVITAQWNVPKSPSANEASVPQHLAGRNVCELVNTSKSSQERSNQVVAWEVARCQIREP